MQTFEKKSSVVGMVFVVVCFMGMGIAVATIVEMYRMPSLVVAGLLSLLFVATFLRNRIRRYELHPDGTFRYYRNNKLEAEYDLNMSSVRIRREEHYDSEEKKTTVTWRLYIQGTYDPKPHSFNLSSMGRQRDPLMNALYPFCD